MNYRNTSKVTGKVVDPCNTKAAYSQGVRYIGVSTKSRKDVCKHLYSKGYSSNTISAVTEKLVLDGYIDERIYAHKKIMEILALKPVSTMRIKIILLEKGIDCNIIDDVLSEYDIDDTQIAEDILIERFGSINSAFGGVNIKKVEALLRYRGFSFRVIRELIEKTGVEAWEEIQD